MIDVHLRISLREKLVKRRRQGKEKKITAAGLD
jgi:hypothetical protein